MGRTRDRLGENGGKKGIEKKAIGHYSKKIPIETGRSGPGMAVGQGDGKMPLYCPPDLRRTDQNRQRAMLKKVRT